MGADVSPPPPWPILRTSVLTVRYIEPGCTLDLGVDRPLGTSVLTVRYIEPGCTLDLGVDRPLGTSVLTVRYIEPGCTLVARGGGGQALVRS